jgi:hypothetical protein
MATSPQFTTTPNVGVAVITTTYAQVKSDGTSAGSGTDRMVLAFTAGANGSGGGGGGAGATGGNGGNGGDGLVIISSW